jgi:hypothetical protein
LYNNEFLFTLLAVLGGFIIIFAIIGIVLYILISIGLYRLALNAGIQNPWLAWLPIGNMYILGSLVKRVKIGELQVPNLGVVLAAGMAVIWLGSAIPVIGPILSLAYAVLIFITLYNLYLIYRPQQAVLWLILGIVLAFLTPIFIFIMRNDRPVGQM